MNNVDLYLLQFLNLCIRLSESEENFEKWETKFTLNLDKNL